MAGLPENQQLNPDFIPIVRDNDQIEISGSVIDEALAKKLDAEGLLKLKAVEETVKLMKSRAFQSIETVEKVYDMFFSKIKQNGTNSKQELR